MKTTGIEALGQLAKMELKGFTLIIHKADGENSVATVTCGNLGNVPHDPVLWLDWKDGQDPMTRDFYLGQTWDLEVHDERVVFLRLLPRHGIPVAPFESTLFILLKP